MKYLGYILLMLGVGALLAALNGYTQQFFMAFVGLASGIVILRNDEGDEGDKGDS